MRLSRPSWALVAAPLLAAACGRSDSRADDPLVRDLTLAASAAAGRARADSIAFADTAVALHAVRDSVPVPAERPAARRAPRPALAAADAPPAPATPMAEPAPADSAALAASASAAESAPLAAGVAALAGRTFGAGTTMSLATASPICHTSSRPGDRFVATLSEPVAASDGSTLPPGTDVVVELSSLLLGAGGRGRIQLLARGISIDGFVRPLDAEVAWVDAMLERRRVPPPPGTGSDAGKVGRGAMTGAILGRVFGGRGAKGTVIGAAAGAAAGAVGARGDATFESCLPAGSPVRMRLTGPLTIGT